MIYYYARSDLKSFIEHNFINGFWAIMPMKFVSHMPVALRHLVPFVFVTSLVSLGLLSFVSIFFFRLILLILIVYFLSNFYFSTQIALRERNWRYIFPLSLVFTLLHVSYGLGSLSGISRVITSRQFWKNRFKG